VLGGRVTRLSTRLDMVKRRFVYSIFLLLPRGAGSMCGKFGAFLSTGVLLYVTVRVTTSRTLTRLVRPVFFSRSHVFGETAEYGDLSEFALAGDRTDAGENMGDCGM
jgi:hypothetical protein